MSGNIQKIQSVIENKITIAIKELSSVDSRLISDLYIQADPETGELQVYDEEENLICKVVIFDWVNSPEDEDEFNKKVSTIIKNALSNIVAKKLFDHPCFTKPFSVTLTDDQFQVIEELLFLDDETFRLDDPLLKDLDAELDTFLENLLSDVE